jgi:hypothetical protein
MSAAVLAARGWQDVVHDTTEIPRGRLAAHQLDVTCRRPSLWNGMIEWMPTVTSLGKDLFTAVLAAILVSYIQRRLSDRRGGTTGSDDGPLASSPSPDVRARCRPARAPASAQPPRVPATRRLASHALNMTPEQEAGLIERGLTEIVVRSGTLDYASLTSGCMADRIRSGYA